MKQKSAWKLRGIAGLAAIAITAGSAERLAYAGNNQANDFDGRWTATIKQGEHTIPFRLDIVVNGKSITGKLFNGTEDFETTSSARIDNGTVQLNFEHYLTNITASLQGGELDGQLTVTRRGAINITPGAAPSKPHDTVSPFHARRYVAPTAAQNASAPSIDGLWELPHESPKGEKSWRLIVKQTGAEISASVLRVDGDTGALTGIWQDGKFVASHFDGSRPGLIEITPQTDGSLRV
jgi:hypothetical protein